MYTSCNRNSKVYETQKEQMQIKTRKEGIVGNE
jgi:hypothetical protein